MKLGSAAVALGIGIHLQGAGSRISCAAILVAGVVGLLPTLLAHRAVRSSLRSAFAAAMIVSLGQLAMHVSLSAPALSPRISPTDMHAVCLLLAHGIATVVLTAYLLGLQRTLQLVAEVYARLRSWLRVSLVVPRPCPVVNTLPDSAVRRGFAAATPTYQHGRRGPPLPA